MSGAEVGAVELVAAVPAIILAVTEILLIDTLAIAAVFAAPGTGSDLAHEGQQGLTAGQLPLLPVISHHRLDTLTCRISLSKYF